jgi:hypothetical protein
MMYMRLAEIAKQLHTQPSQKAHKSGQFSSPHEPAEMQQQTLKYPSAWQEG